MEFYTKVRNWFQAHPNTDILNTPKPERTAYSGKRSNGGDWSNRRYITHKDGNTRVWSDTGETYYTQLP